MQQIGVFGASFNPPTWGHQDVIQQAAKVFDKILLVPSVAHAFAKQLAPLSYRLAMLNLLLSTWDNQPIQQQLEICLIETAMQPQKLPERKTGSIYTFDVLTKLTEQYARQNTACQLRFIIGPDNNQPAIWQKFYRYQEIEQKWPLYVAKEQIPIHSTIVREIIWQHKENPAVLRQKLMLLVPAPIAEYLIAHRLYQEEPADGN